jgi:hypothetical protein
MSEPRPAVEVGCLGRLLRQIEAAASICFLTRTQALPAIEIE